ncbi:hypothetical protein GWI33_001132, partial [Rhynchophorus ferrugineus]
SLCFRIIHKMLPIFVGLMLVSFANAQQQAVAVLSGSITGEIVFTEKSDTVYITGTVSGLTEGNHGFHIHSKGDLRNGCTSTGSHFNPLNVTHGGPTSSTRHVGDLGNIAANSSGIALIDITDSIIALRGDNNIVGRAVVVHADHDDLGKGFYLLLTNL